MTAGRGSAHRNSQVAGQVARLLDPEDVALDIRRGPRQSGHLEVGHQHPRARKRRSRVPHDLRQRRRGERQDDQVEAPAGDAADLEHRILAGTDVEHARAEADADRGLDEAVVQIAPEPGVFGQAGRLHQRDPRACGHAGDGVRAQSQAGDDEAGGDQRPMTDPCHQTMVHGCASAVKPVGLKMDSVPVRAFQTPCISSLSTKLDKPGPPVGLVIPAPIRPPQPRHRRLHRLTAE